jgi:hypothetical protein
MSFDFDVEIIDLSQGVEPARYLASGVDISNISKINTIQSFCSIFKPLFNQTYKTILKNLLTEFNSVLNLGKSGSAVNSYNLNGNDQSLSADSILKENNLENINCKEGEYSYQYYVECAVLKLNALNQYIFSANTALTKIEQLMASGSMSADQKIENQAQVLFDQLKIYDALAFELVKDFSSYYVFKTDPRKKEYAEYWEEQFVDFSQSSYTSQSKIGSLSSYYDLEALRQLKVESYVYDDTNDAWSVSDKKLTAFNELTLFDKLKYIYLYYKLDLSSSGENRVIFPNDARFGYPCVPNKISTSATEETKELGALELFYVGYLIDRDGPINALSSFLEIKTQALRENIAIVMRKISALRQYLAFIRRALELLNASQANGGSNILPDAAYLALTYISGGVIRNLMELKDAQGNYLKDSQGNEIRDPFIVIQIKDTTTADEYHLTNTNRYLLVKATEEGIKSFLERKDWEFVEGVIHKELITNQDIQFNTQIAIGKPPDYFYNDDRPQIPTDQEVVERHYGQLAEEPTIPSDHLSTTLANAPYTIYDNILYLYNQENKTIYYSYERNGSWNRDGEYEYHYDITIKDSSSSSSISITQKNVFPHSNDGNIYLLQFSNQEQAKQWLPKEIKSTPINPTSALGYNREGSYDFDTKTDYRKYWRNHNTTCGIWTAIVDSWTTVINTSIENMKNTIEGINNEVSTMRSKIDTFNATSSTFRNRAYSTYSTIVNNIR